MWISVDCHLQTSIDEASNSSPEEKLLTLFYLDLDEYSHKLQSHILHTHTYKDKRRTSRSRLKFQFGRFSIQFISVIGANFRSFISIDYRTDTSMWPPSIGCRPLWAPSPSTCVTWLWRLWTDMSIRTFADIFRDVHCKRKTVSNV